MASDVADIEQPASGQGADSPSAARAPRGFGMRYKRKTIGEIRVRCDAEDARVFKALRRTYGVDLAQLVRLLGREKYAEIYGAGAPPKNGDEE